MRPFSDFAERFMEAEPDFKDVLACLNGRQVEYLIVGSFALAFHGKPRATGDIDILIRPTPENARRIADALADFGIALPNITAADFEQPGTVVQLGVPPVRIDLITSITGVTWDEAHEGRVAGSVGDVPVWFLGLSQFIANKKATGRPKDLGDIDGLA